MAYPCPRCGHHVLSAPPGPGVQCPVCATREVPATAPRTDDAPAWAPIPGGTSAGGEPHLNGDARIGQPARPEAEPAPEQFPTPHVPGWGPRRPDRLISPRSPGSWRTRSRPGTPRGALRPRPSGVGPDSVQPAPPAPDAEPPAPAGPDRLSSTSRVRAAVGPGAAALRQQGARVRVVVAATDDRLTDDHLWFARRWGPRVVAVGLVLTLLATGWPRAVLGVLTGVAVLGLLGALGWTWWRLGPRRWWVFGGDARRDQLAEIHADAVAASLAPGIELVRVRRVHHTANHGSRCLVETVEGRSRDAWFWHARPRRGAVLLVRAQPANPAHTTDLHLLHVGSEATGPGIVQRLPRASWRAGERGRRRDPGAADGAVRDVPVDDGGAAAP
ncbi:hypothetical protein ACWFNE_02680 [Cellulomonas sp. NPDC055163]